MAALEVAPFDGLAASNLPLTDVPLLLKRLEALAARAQRSYLVDRLRTALDYLSRKGSTETLETELRSLADLDAERKYASYGIVRTMLWTMPFIGGLGTLLGIAKTIGSGTADAPAAGLSTLFPPGLVLALDTTVLAVLLTVVLLLVMFMADHFESRLLVSVDARTNRELVGRFRSENTSKGGPAGATAAGGTGMVEVMEKIADRQSEMWQASLDAATKRWDEQTDILKKTMDTSGTAVGGGGGGGGIVGGGGAGAAAGAVRVDAAHLQEALLKSGGFAGPHQHPEFMGNNEIILELAEVVRGGCRNWPVRKAMRRKFGPQTAAGDVETDWLDRT